ELAEFIWGSRKGEPWALTSAVDDLKIDFTLSPNPVRNQLTISSDEPDLSYSIFNLNGQLLQENDLYGTQVISVDNLNNGMYLIQVKSGNRRTVQKFIVSH
ncbi:MAG TPA: T9SS type A sorting domain-containing protein, partial [Paludibacteraceae bacterium]|nr:T9SS type A sorting domain-containing protein [Paludibacteraceae bacterium]